MKRMLHGLGHVGRFFLETFLQTSPSRGLNMAVATLSLQSGLMGLMGKFDRGFGVLNNVDRHGIRRIRGHSGKAKTSRGEDDCQDQTGCPYSVLTIHAITLLLY